MICYDNILDENYSIKYNLFCQEILADKYFKENILINPNKLINNIIEKEKKHHTELKELSLKLVKREFPIINEIEHKTFLKITSDIELWKSNSPTQTNKSDKLITKINKQKIINGIIQGAAFNVNNIHYIIEELKEYGTNNDYKNLIKITNYIYYGTPTETFKKTAILKSKNKNVDGRSDVKINNGIPYFNIKSSTFLILIHEMVKGLYTYLSLNAYKTEEEYDEITKYTDSITNEIDDIKHGNFIYISIKNYLVDNYYSYYYHPCFFEMFFIELCKVQSDSFISLINDIISNKKNHDIQNICHDCVNILKKYDQEKFVD